MVSDSHRNYNTDKKEFVKGDAFAGLPKSEEASSFLPKCKPAAIWARVSTRDQSETSIPSQVDRCKVLLEKEGYSATHILQADWTSIDLFSCPEFQQLRKLIANREIEALAIFDRDRLVAKGLQRLIFLSDCKEADVKLCICQGSPILNEPEGQLVELALAIGKERSVLRARQGSRDGLHDRATKRRLPVTYHNVYGYRWDKCNNRLLPDPNWDNLKLIFDMVLSGATYNPILLELKNRGILSPSGQAEWNKTTLSAIIHNPIYAGRYYALKKQAVTPVKRRGNTYGNSSCRKVPLDQAHYIPEIEVENPPIIWEQREQIISQLVRHQKLAQRNAKRDYLLRGFIFCDTHSGKQGEPRRYHGQPDPHHGGTWRYACPVGGCTMPNINGPRIEEYAKQVIRFCLMLQPSEFYELIANRHNCEELKRTLQRELYSLEVKYNKNINAEAELENRSLSGQMHPEVYPRLKAKFRVERQWIEDRKLSVNEQLAQLNREAEAVASLVEIRKKFAGRLDKLANTEWRDLLNMLNLEIHIEAPSIDASIPINWFPVQTDDVCEREGIQRLNNEESKRYQEEIEYGKIKGLIRFHIGVPLWSSSLDGSMAQLTPQISGIVLNSPGRG